MGITDNSLTLNQLLAAIASSIPKGSKVHVDIEIPSLNGIVFEKKPIPEQIKYTQEQIDAMIKRQSEIANFFSYDGTPQPNPDEPKENVK